MNTPNRRIDTFPLAKVGFTNTLPSRDAPWWVRTVNATSLAILSHARWSMAD